MHTCCTRLSRAVRILRFWPLPFAVAAFSPVVAGADSPWSSPPPGVATPIAPGELSTPDYELGLTLSPDLRTAYVTRLTSDRDQPTLYQSHWDGSHWSAARPINFHDAGAALSPSLSSDGREMIFSRIEPGKRTPTLWRSRWNGTAWASPEPIGGALALPEGIFNPEWAPDGTLYFASPRADPFQYELYRSRLEDGAFQPPEPVDRWINSRYDETGITLSPDGRLLVFASTGRTDRLGETDLYLSQNRDGRWTSPRRLNTAVNTKGNEMNPRFSPDGERLFFSRSGDLYQVSTAALTVPSVESLGAWQMRASLPASRVWARSVSLNGKIYLVGGCTGWGPGTGPTQTLDEYDPMTDRWTSRAAPPNGDVMAPAVAFEGKILCFQREPGVLGFEYDPSADRWTPRRGSVGAFHPTPHNSAAVVDGRILVLRCLWTAPSFLADLSEYDPAGNRWISRGAVPLPAPSFAVAGQDRLYLVGGGTDGSGFAQFEPKTGKWTLLPSLNGSRIEVRGAEWRGQIVAVGGHTSEGTTVDTVEIFDPATGVWTRLPGLPEVRWGVSVAVCHDRLFVIGGCSSSVGQSTASTTVWEYVPEQP